METQDGFGEIKKSWAPIQNPSPVTAEHQRCYLASLAPNFIIYEIESVVSHQELWSKEPGVGPLRAAPCKGVEFDEAQTNRQKIHLRTVTIFKATVLLCKTLPLGPNKKEAEAACIHCRWRQTKQKNKLCEYL